MLHGDKSNAVRRAPRENRLAKPVTHPVGAAAGQQHGASLRGRGQKGGAKDALANGGTVPLVPRGASGRYKRASKGLGRNPPADQGA